MRGIELPSMAELRCIPSPTAMLRRELPSWQRYVAAVLVIAGITAALASATAELGVLNIAQLYLIACLLLVVALGPRPGAFAAIVAAIAFDYFFMLPYHTFTIARADHEFVLVAFLVVALVTGRLVSRVHAETEAARREQRRTAQLVTFTGALLGKVTRDAMLRTIVEQVVAISGAARCRILLYDNDGTLTERASFPPQDVSPTPASRLPARATIGPRRAAPRKPGHPRAADVRTMPIGADPDCVGVLEVTAPGAGLFSRMDEPLLTGLTNQTALVLERGQLAEEAARAAALAESDRLKSALLAAVSHDLRTPLATIRTAATALLDGSVTWEEDDRRAFLQTIDDEAHRLALLVTNLLDLSRIEGGALRSDKAWHDVADVVDDVVDRLERLGGDHRITTEIEPGLPLACFDDVQIAQVLVNLGENAINYTPPGTPITLAARSVPGAIELAVHDAGPGIPAARRSRLFEMFYRADTPGSGIGLGLVICKGLVEANGGQIWVESQVGAGTTFRFTLPQGDDAADGADRER